MPDARPSDRYFRLTGLLASPGTRLNRSAHYRAHLQRLRADLIDHRVRLISFSLLPDAWHLVVAAEYPKSRSIR